MTSLYGRELNRIWRNRRVMITGILMSEVTRYQLRQLEFQERDELLASRTSAMLAFVDGNGFPRLVPCWFLWDGTAFYVTSFTDKFHVRCLRRNPRASIGIEVAHTDAEAIGNRQVKGVGNVMISDDVDGCWARRIRRKYLGTDVPDFTGGPQRVVITLEPHHLTAHGGGMKLARKTSRVRD